jgi:3-phenylpropionate/cinnamic acid dioxygenase small subunit
VINVEFTFRLTQLLYHESKLLDNGEFHRWLALLADDIDYTAPISEDLDPNDTANPLHRE